MENTRNYPGLHFTAKPIACDALKNCLNQLRGEGAGARRTMPLQILQPKDETKITGGQKYKSFSRLRITLHKESDILRQMSFRAEADSVYFDFTDRFLTEFESGLSDVKLGSGDYSIEPEEKYRLGLQLGELDKLSECLWFWPCFGHLRVS